MEKAFEVCFALAVGCLQLCGVALAIGATFWAVRDFGWWAIFPGAALTATFVCTTIATFLDAVREYRGES